MDPILVSSHGSSLGPRFGVQIWTQKWGQPSENFVADRGSFASRFATLKHEHECWLNTCLFLPVRPTLLLVQLRSLYGFPVSTSFLACFGGHDEAGLSPDTKSLAAECLFGVRLGLLTLSTSACMDLFWLLAFGRASRLASC